MTEAKKKRHYGVAANTPNRIVLPERHVIVLVGGTVDPTNFWEDINLPEDKHDSTHSRGYSQSGEKKKDPKYWATASDGARDSHDDNWYWETNPAFREKLGTLRAHATNMQVFTMHGWTGDNAPRNREIAGAYLCDRLCGGAKENAYYVGWRDSPVMFHLVGHSHGGNVVNEFTRRAASSSAWPAKWKIRTVTYLSTPFFKDLHPIDTGAFHKDCIIVNAFNKYDLTQRVVADFNLQQLNGVLTLADFGEVKKAIKELDFNGKLLYALQPAGVHDMDPSFWGVDLRAVMDTAKAVDLYNGTLDLIKKLDNVFAKVHQIISLLHRGVVFPLALQFVDKMCAGREVVTARLAKRFHTEIDRLRNGIELTRKALEARKATGLFPVTGFIDDIYPLDFLEPFIAFIETDKATFKGTLLELIAALLEEQLVKFDNTTHTPAAKLRGTAFESKINNVEVTKYDRYMRPAADPYRPQFDKFIAALEAIERKYAASRSQRDLLDLVFTMAAQVPDVREFVGKWLSTAQWAERGIAAVDLVMKADAALGTSYSAQRFVALVRRLARAILNLAEILHERDVGEMLVPPAKLRPEDPKLPIGSLDYFMRVSHSVSRSDLWPEILVLWLDQLLPPSRAQGGSRQGG